MAWTPAPGYALPCAGILQPKCRGGRMSGASEDASSGQGASKLQDPLKLILLGGLATGMTSLLVFCVANRYTLAEDRDRLYKKCSQDMEAIGRKTATSIRFMREQAAPVLVRSADRATDLKVLDAQRREWNSL